MSDLRLIGGDGGRVQPPRLAAGLMLYRGVETDVRVLLIQRPHLSSSAGGLWSIPGGFHERGDRTLMETARREFAEEMGVQSPWHPSQKPLLSTVYVEKHASKPNVHYHTFLVPAYPALTDELLLESNPRIVSSEVANAAWVSVETELWIADEGLDKDDVDLHPGVIHTLRLIMGRMDSGAENLPEVLQG
jgi:8-oxo-dGTP pyrophosphatase MutT (NUDIX family)